LLCLAKCWSKVMPLLYSQRRRLEANPMDAEAQSKLEEIIRLQNVENNRLLALEHTPEVFFRWGQGAVGVPVHRCASRGHGGCTERTTPARPLFSAHPPG
jgi:hypothetical protein